MAPEQQTMAQLQKIIDSSTMEQSSKTQQPIPISTQSTIQQQPIIGDQQSPLQAMVSEQLQVATAPLFQKTEITT